MTKSTVCIVDDEQGICDTLAWLLEAHDFKTISFTDPEAFLKQAEKLEITCLILDVNMPKISGLEVQEALKEKHCAFPVIFISAHSDIHAAVQTFKAGADDFFLKPINNQQLINSINNLTLKYSRSECIYKRRESVSTEYSLLSKREKEVAQFITEGHTSKKIGGTLSISKNTVDAHKANILKKMGCASVKELIYKIAYWHCPYSNKSTRHNCHLFDK